MKRSETTCLHMDQSGIIWGMTPQGAARPILSQDLDKVLRAGSYRIVGLPENYRLITQLYALLVRRKAKAPIWVGSPEVCPRRNCAPDLILSCLSVLEVHDNLHTRWHAVINETYNNFLLLGTLQQEGFSDLTTQIYNSHCLRPFCQFLGLNDVGLAIELIAHIVDPRWYINPSRPYRMSRLESYFGLVPTQLKTQRPARQRRFEALAEAFDALPSDSPLWGEVAARAESKSGRVRGYRMLLGFLARNWLARLTTLDHFDPTRFFVRPESRTLYIRQFKE